MANVASVPAWPLLPAAPSLGRCFCSDLAVAGCFACFVLARVWLQPEPPTSRFCNLLPCPSALVTWDVGHWGPCTAPLAEVESCVVSRGNRTREVVCRDGTGAYAPDARCQQPRPEGMEACEAASSCYCLSPWDCFDDHKVRRNVHCARIVFMLSRC